MAKAKSVTPRKQPIQARSRQMMADILEAAARVLIEDGLACFNTNRVAEVAGVSIGSLYQYFPNKESLLLQLQEQEASQTWSALEAMLTDETRSARDRLHDAIHYFFRSEQDEQELQQGLRQAAIFFEQSPEQAQIEALAEQHLLALVRQAQTQAGQETEPSQLQFKVRYVVTAVSAIAARVTQQAMDEGELSRWAKACSDTLCDYLDLP